MNAGRVALKRILALEYVEYNPTDLALIGHNIQLIHFFQKNRQPSGRVCESACQSDTCVLFMAKKPSGNCLDSLMFYLHLSAFGISFTNVFCLYFCYWVCLPKQNHKQ